MATTQFRLRIEQWKNNTPEQLAALARQSTQELARRIVEATPVDTGFLRGSWQPSLNATSEGPSVKQITKHAVRRNAEAASAASSGFVGPKIAATILGIKPGDKFYMSNNAAYALRMEHGFFGEDSLGRTYHQAGRYFVTGTVAQWPGIVAEVAAQLGLTKGGGSGGTPAPAPPSGPPSPPSAPAAPAAPKMRMTQYGPRKA